MSSAKNGWSLRSESSGSDFGIAGNPVGRREGDAPECGCRFHELDAHFGVIELRVYVNNAAGLFFFGVGILDGDQLPDGNFCFEIEKTAMGADHQGVRLLGDRLSVRAEKFHGDGDA
jgi:hypothetical protein